MSITCALGIFFRYVTLKDVQGLNFLKRRSEESSADNNLPLRGIFWCTRNHVFLYQIETKNDMGSQNGYNFDARRYLKFRNQNILVISNYCIPVHVSRFNWTKLLQGVKEHLFIFILHIDFLQRLPRALQLLTMLTLSHVILNSVWIIWNNINRWTRTKTVINCRIRHLEITQFRV